jgi:ADP-ribosylation factor-like protein 13B
VYHSYTSVSFAYLVSSLANKQDREGALDELDIVDLLNVEAVVNQHHCPTTVEMCSATAVKKSRKKLDPGIGNGFR